jgi:hypothetical protein
VSQAQLLIDIGHVVVVFTFVVSVLFTPVVSTFWPWWQHGIGRTVAAEAIALALAFAPSAFHVLFGLNVTGQLVSQWLVLVCIAAVPGILVWRAVIIYLTQRRGARRGSLTLVSPEDKAV